MPKPQSFTVDERVTHDKHGLGTVVTPDEEGCVIVNFGSETRRISLSSAKLHKL